MILIAGLAALAGCVGGDDGDKMATWTFAEAMAAGGATFEPTGDAPAGLRLKLLEPTATDALPTGRLDVAFLLYDSAAEMPITDGSFVHPNESGCAVSHSFCAEMPAMGHGTSPEESPSHVGDGVYRGSTTLSMSGAWLLRINPQLAGGSVASFNIDLRAEG